MRDDPHSLRTALSRYLVTAGLPGDSGVAARWVRVRFLGLPIVFPNFHARRRVLVMHDVHHLLTGYTTTWTGEGEIGAFEIATGCKDLWAAWMFNGGGFLFGLVIAPVRTFRAFVRGRRCRNFYGEDQERVLDRTVDAARRELGLERMIGAARPADLLAFVGWAAVVIAVSVALPLLLLWWLAAVGGWYS